jgi:hypothetical protein
MIVETSETYNCEEKGCGRKFEDKEGLLSHYHRRHIHLYNKYKDIRQDEDIPEVINEERLDEEINKWSIEKSSATVTDSMSLSTTGLERLKIITEELLGVGTKYAGLDEIEEVLILFMVDLFRR